MKESDFTEMKKINTLYKRDFEKWLNNGSDLKTEQLSSGELIQKFLKDIGVK